MANCSKCGKKFSLTENSQAGLCAQCHYEESHLLNPQTEERVDSHESGQESAVNKSAPSFYASFASIFAIVLLVLALVSPLLFLSAAGDACPSWRSRCDISEQMLKNTYQQLAIFSFFGGITSFVFFGVLGEIAKHLAAIRRHFETDDED